MVGLLPVAHKYTKFNNALARSGPFATAGPVMRRRASSSSVQRRTISPTPANNKARHGPPTGRLSRRGGRINQWPGATARAGRIAADPRDRPYLSYGKAASVRHDDGSFPFDSGGRKRPPTGRLAAMWGEARWRWPGRKPSARPRR